MAGLEEGRRVLMARLNWLELWDNLQERLIRKEVWTRDELVRLMNTMEHSLYRVLNNALEEEIEREL